MYQPKQLQETSLLEATHRIWYCCSGPLWVSLVVSVVTLLHTRWDDVLVAAVTGQMALTLIKLFLYVAALILSLATALAGVPLVPRVLRFAGERLGSVAFDSSSVVIGVLVGILPVAIIQEGCAALFATIVVVVVMLFIQAVLWFFCRAAFGKPVKGLAEHPRLLRGLAVAAVILFALGLHYESWDEVVKQKCPPGTSHATAAAQQ